MREEDIPIDIHTLKLQDWLVSRRIVPKNIQTTVKDIRCKICNALKDMPSTEQDIQLLTGPNINYFHCKEIVEILKKTEKDTKSIFGSYGSQRMKDWLDILRLYEKDNVYLAELASSYVRNINYEIPSLRKRMTKLEQQREECLKKCQDLNKSENALVAEHTALLQQIGIKGDNLQNEFTAAIANLPVLYEESIKNIKCLKDAIDLYADVSGSTQCMPITRHLMEFGNTTVYQYVHKEAPLIIEEPPFKLHLKLAANTNAGSIDNEIDFGDDNGGGTSSTISAEIIDYDELNSPGNAADIDWGMDATQSDEAVKINFDIPLDEYGVVMEATGMDGGIAKGDQACTILDSTSYRERFINEFYELEAFLQLRLYELRQLESSSSIMLFSLMDSISTHDEESLQKMMDNVNNMLNTINSEHIRHLIQLKHSAKYANLLASKLEQMLKAVQKIQDTKESLKIRAEGAKQERLTLNPLLDDLVIKTKQMQQQIEQEISKRYKNRVVNLLGGVN